MDEFLSWPGWAGVSGIAQLVALVTLVGAAWRFILQRRQMPLFALDYGVLGSASRDGIEYHVVEFRNTGRGSAELHLLEFFGASVRFEQDFVAPRVLMPGGTFRLMLSSPVLKNVWFRLTWRTPDAKGRVTLAWWPLVYGPVRDQWKADVRDGKRFSRRVIRALRPRQVAPGKELRAAFHARGWESIDRIRTVPDRDVLYSLGTHHNFHPTDIPFDEALRGKS